MPELVMSVYSRRDIVYGLIDCIYKLRFNFKPLFLTIRDKVARKSHCRVITSTGARHAGKQVGAGRTAKWLTWQVYAQVSSVNLNSVILCKASDSARPPRLSAAAAA
jgi:hypothetical protein